MFWAAGEAPGIQVDQGGLPWAGPTMPPASHNAPWLARLIPKHHGRPGLPQPLPHPTAPPLASPRPGGPRPAPPIAHSSLITSCPQIISAGPSPAGRCSWPSASAAACPPPAPSPPPAPTGEWPRGPRTHGATWVNREGLLGACTPCPWVCSCSGISR